MKLIILIALLFAGCDLPQQQHENTCTCHTYESTGTTICHCDDDKQTVIEGKVIE